MRSSLRFPSQSVHAFSLASQPVPNRSPGTALPRRRVRPVLAAPTHPPAPSFESSIEAVSSSAGPLERSRGQLLGVALQGTHCPAHVRHLRDAPLRASSSGLILALLGAVLGFSAYYTLRAGQSPPQDIEHLSERLASMTTEIGPGRPGNLTPEEEEKLRRLWQLIFQVCRVGQEQNGAGADNDSGAANDKAQDADTKKVKKSRMSIFSRKGRKDSDADSASGASANSPVLLNLSKDGDADKYGQTKQFYDALASQSPESIRDTIWSMVKHDHPDALVLRFLRARKWDVERALIMLVSTIHWRAQEMKLDEDIMRNGEAAALAAEESSDPAARKLGHDFMAQIRKGISYVHGVDKQGRPLCFVNVRLHRQGEQVEGALERYTVYLIETCRMLLQPPVDTATIVFDMTNFSMANMDYTPVRFMIKCFEANYPECLGTVLVHKAPWIFQGIWKIIRGWLDPVVAKKVHFTNNAQEMEEFIPLRHIPKDLEGEENWTYEYVEPRDGENDKLNDTDTRDRLLEARAGLYKEYEEATLEWIQNPEGDKAAEIKARRNEIASKLRDDYWNIDPYVRARSYYDRIGVIQPGGTLNWYPEEKEALVNGAAGPAAPETSPDDVD